MLIIIASKSTFVIIFNLPKKIHIEKNLMKTFKTPTGGWRQCSKLYLKALSRKNQQTKKTLYRPSIKLRTNIDLKTEAIVVIAAKNTLDRIILTSDCRHCNKIQTWHHYNDEEWTNEKKNFTNHPSNKALTFSKTLWNQIPLLTIISSEFIC